MKKLIPLMMGLALTFGAVTMYASNAAPQKATKAKATKKAPKKSTKS